MLTDTPALGQRRPAVQQRSISYGTPNNAGQAPRFSPSTQTPTRPTIVRSSSSSEHTIARVAPPQRAATAVLVLDDAEQEDLNDRPRKRVRLGPDAKEELSLDSSEVKQEQKGVEHVNLGKSVGLPPLQIGRNREYELTSSNGLGESAVRRADGLAPPPMAPRLPPPPQFNVADFFPWTGLHPEDRLDEQVVKSGYADKALSPNQNESNSARQTLWPGLSQKNHIALHNLSLLFAQVLEKRQALGRFTTQSTFKPPPRVTVTDTKREAWLRDLANPLVPLRRQSRTIPHGIRGRSLLEQCIAKSIPLQRAVWLAKCVGANELRAFRRKGVSGASSAQGEAKWIREWTLSVEHFLHDTMHKSGNDWKADLEYAIRLTSTLFYEALLEKDHFLGWLVGCLADSHLDLLPMWLLIAQTFWTDLLSLEKIGRKLAQALLQRLADVVHDDHAAYQSLERSLQQCLGLIADRASGCLVMSTSWQEHEHALCYLPNYTELCERNERLAGLGDRGQRKSALVQLYDSLDAVDLELDLPALTRRFAELIPNISVLITALLQYAATKYRDNKPHQFLIRELVARYADEGADVDTAILLLLSQPPRDMSLERLFVIIADLTATGHASAGRYVQWLITAGAVANQESKHINLLHSLVSDTLPQYLRNTVASLLNRTGRTSLFQFAMQETIEQIEGAIRDEYDVTDISYPRGMLDGWILHEAKVLTESGHFSLHAFCTMRCLLARLGRPEALQQLLEIALHTDDFHVLGSIADTVNRHALELAVKSALPGLVEQLVSRYRALRTQQPLERSSIHALRDLVTRLSGKVAIQKLLSGDLAIHEQQNLNAACSPASDNLINMQAGNMDSDGEIDAVFASGNAMDEILMGRVFHRIMQVVERETKSGGKPSRVCQWLNQLRLLDRTAFEGQVAKHLSGLISSNATIRGVYALVASDCLRFDQVISSCHSHAHLLAFIIDRPPADLGLSEVEQYHFLQRQHSYCDDHTEELSQVLRDVLQTQHATDDARLLALAMQMASSSKFDSLLSSSADELLLSNACDLSTRVLKGVESLDTEADMHPQMVTSMATALNSRFCSMWLKSYSSMYRTDTEQEACRDAIIQAIQAGSPVWPELLAACGGETVQHLHSWALQQVLGEEVRIEDKWALFDATFTQLEKKEPSAVLASTAARLRTIEKRVHEDASAQDQLIESWLRAVLHVVVTYSQQDGPDHNTSSRGQIVLLLCSILTSKLEMDQALAEYVHDVVSMQIDFLPMEIVTSISEKLKSIKAHDLALSALLPSTDMIESWLSLATPVRTAKPAGNNAVRPSLALQTGPQNTTPQRVSAADMKYMPYMLKRWDVIQDPTPMVGENDSSINLALFDARKVF